MTVGQIDWRRLTAEAALARLRSRRAGLSHDESAARRREHGLNVLDEPPPRAAWAIFLAQLADYRTLVLLGAALSRASSAI